MKFTISLAACLITKDAYLIIEDLCAKVGWQKSTQPINF